MLKVKKKKKKKQHGAGRRFAGAIAAENSTPIPSLRRVPTLDIVEALVRSGLEDNDGMAEYSIEIGEKYVRQHPEWLQQGGTVDEAAGLGLYSLEYPDREGSFYFIVNGLLRNSDPTTREQLKPYTFVMKLQSSAVELLPAYKGVVWRGVGKDVSAIYRKHMEASDVLRDWSFCSTSTSMKVRLRFLSVWGGGQDCTMVQKGHLGRHRERWKLSTESDAHANAKQNASV